MSVSSSARGRCVSASMDDASRPRGIDSSMRARPAHCRARARWRGFFPPFLLGHLCPTRHLRPSALLPPPLRPFPLLCSPRVPSRSRRSRVARVVLLRGGRSGGFSNIHDSPPPARHTCHLYHPEIIVITVIANCN